MLGPLVKAQLVALLTKKLLDSPLFVRSVERLHGSFSNLTENAYDKLYQATIEAEKTDSIDKASTSSSTSPPPRQPPPRQPPPPLEQDVHRPTPDQPIKVQNDELRRLIEKTKRDLNRRR